MIKLRANFEADWITHLKKQLDFAWGSATISDLADHDIPIYYFETFRRKISVQPREIKIADDFYCPPQDKGGWNLLQSKVRRGDDLNPHLSTRHASISNDDGLLAEWGVHHFHVGTKPYPHDPYYADRTASLVLALVGDNTFYAINVFPHGDWENIKGIIRLTQQIRRRIQNARDRPVAYVNHGFSSAPRAMEGRSCARNAKTIQPTR